MRILRDYQKDLLEKINQNHHKKICVQLATGGGKTVIFSELAESYNGRVLILVDSTELVIQTSDHIKGAGTFEAKDDFIPNDKVIISMAQTLRSRIKKTPEMINDFDLIIIDECHVLCYEQVLKIATCKVIGFTATPVSNRVDKYFFDFEQKQMYKEHLDGRIEFKKDFYLSDIFEDIIIGIPISQLIEKGFLVPDENYVIPVDENDFKFDSFGEVSNSEEVFDVKFQMDVLQNYLQFCKGKKTLIFTQNTNLNNILYNQFVENGIENVFMYDSVNLTEYNRSETVNKFRDTPGSILFNVGCFTKGFDVTDVEAIIVARRVSSLSLWIQIVGRGSRTTDKLFKDKFIVIDGGTNIQRLGRWSEDFDWNNNFWCKGDYKPKKEAPEEETKDCENCGQLMNIKACLCKACDFNNCKIKDVEILNRIAIKVNSVGIDIDKIIKYSEGKDKIFALKVLTSQAVRKFDNIDKSQFERNLNGGVERFLDTTFKKAYLKIIQSDLKSFSNRTFYQQKKIVLTKLKKKYDIQ
jgi:superfamily II DNA or RNA helicase